MRVAITNREGGHWEYTELSVAEIGLFMYPNCMFTYGHSTWPAAIRFPNGAIYDNVLARLNEFPWRIDKHSRHWFKSMLALNQ
jgi:hypothetical protein